MTGCFFSLLTACQWGEFEPASERFIFMPDNCLLLFSQLSTISPIFLTLERTSASDSTSIDKTLPEKEYDDGDTR